MMYVTIRRADRLPTVALAQARLMEWNADLTIDGEFGEATARAVRAFQRDARLRSSGFVDRLTWQALMRVHPISVIDVIDSTDITVLEEDRPYLADGHSQVEVSYGMSRGARALIDRLVARYEPKSVALLRLHGHGGPGHMVVSGGTAAGNGSTFAGEHFTNPEAVASYALLGTIMKPYGSIELHGCRVAARSNGKQLLAGLARACRVPVTAGLRFQTGGAAASRFEGPTETQFPPGMALSSWAKRVFSSCQW